ncbi:MAG TPA: trypsin-like peptidase domain-containing protein [Candidatus Polarisedimenticolia bacterium]|nr:trypsin-like peptidase domain-containing protein [Candidatus Polarisedimenticolia bacterium]
MSQLTRPIVVAASIAAACAGAVLAIGPSAQAPAEALQSSERLSPVVQVVAKVSPSVVNVSTEQRVDNPFHPPGPAGSPRSVPGLSDGTEIDPSAGRGGTADQFVHNSLGSGVIIDPRGYILTNEHVLWRASRVQVTLADRRRFDAEVVGVDPRSDLAVLRIAATEPLPAIRAGTSTDLMIGETVIAIGNPYGLSNTVTTGVVSALNRSVRAGDRVYSDFVQTDASINPGNSGGALLSIEGELIGINTAIVNEGLGIGFAIPVDRARKVFDDLVRYGEIRPAWLGLDVKDLSDQGFAAIAAPGELDAGGAVSIPSPGAQVRRVYAGGPAEKAGITAGDLISRMGSDRITSRTDFETMASRLKPGERVVATIRRGTSERKVEVAATEFPLDLAEAYLADQLGLEVGEIPEEVRSRYPAGSLDGVYITNVRNRSRAHLSGLERGDVLRGIYDRHVSDLDGLRKAVRRLVGREAVLLKVVRGRYQYHVSIDLS